LFKKTTKVLDNVGKHFEKRIEEMKTANNNLVDIGKEYGTHMKGLLNPRQKTELMVGIERILDGEEIIDSVSGLGDGKFLGMDTKNNGVLVLTPKRVLFYYLKHKNGYGSEDYPLDEISSINFTISVTGSNIKVHSNNNVLEVMGIPKNEDIEAFVKNTKQYIEKYKAPVAAVSKSNNNLDIAEQIRKFAELRDQGILTEEEFTIQKKKLLGM